jgi:hypothetical protein
MAVFYTAASLSGAFSGLLAYGIGFMKGIAGMDGWQWYSYNLFCGEVVADLAQDLPSRRPRPRSPVAHHLEAASR